MHERGSHRLLERSQTDGVAAKGRKRPVASFDVTRHLDDRLVEWIRQATQRIDVQVHRLGQAVCVRLFLMQPNVDAAVGNTKARGDTPLVAAVGIDTDAKKLVEFFCKQAERHTEKPFALLVQNVNRFLDEIEHHSHHFERDVDTALHLAILFLEYQVLKILVPLISSGD